MIVLHSAPVSEGLMAKRSYAEVVEMLETEIRILRRSCDGMIAAQDWEAQLVALSVAKIVYDKGRTQVSLLKQLEPRRNFYFLSSRNYWKDAIDPKCPLVSIRTPQADHELPRFQPHEVFGIQHDYHLLPFERWWEEPVLTDADGREFSRKNIILQLRDKRGAHPDPEREAADFYAALVGWSSGFQCSTGGGPRQRMPGSPLLTTLCRIGEELLATLANRPVWTRDKDAADCLKMAVAASPQGPRAEPSGRVYEGEIYFVPSNAVRTKNIGKKIGVIFSPVDGGQALRFEEK
jgi:hypothetical protein